VLAYKRDEPVVVPRRKAQASGRSPAGAPQRRPRRPLPAHVAPGSVSAQAQGRDEGREHPL